MSKAQQAFNWISGEIAKGRTVDLNVGMRIIRISPRTWASFERAGYAALRVSKGGSLQVARGKAWDTIILESTRITSS